MEPSTSTNSQLSSEFVVDRLSLAIRKLNLVSDRVSGNADRTEHLRRCRKSFEDVRRAHGVPHDALDVRPRYEEMEMVIGDMLSDAFSAIAPLASDDGQFRTRRVTFLHNCFLFACISCGVTRLPANLPKRPSTRSAT